MIINNVMLNRSSTVALAGNGFGLGEVCEALDCVVGQIAPNPCYMKCRLIYDKAQL